MTHMLEISNLREEVEFYRLGGYAFDSVQTPRSNVDNPCCSEIRDGPSVGLDRGGLQHRHSVEEHANLVFAASASSGSAKLDVACTPRPLGSPRSVDLSATTPGGRLMQGTLPTIAQDSPAGDDGIPHIGFCRVAFEQSKQGKENMDENVAMHSQGVGRTTDKIRLSKSSSLRAWKVLDAWLPLHESEVSDASCSDVARTKFARDRRIAMSFRVSGCTKRRLPMTRSVSNVSLYSESFLLQPESKTRLCLDFISAALLALDAILFPLELFDDSAMLWKMILAWLSTVWWSLDILMNFMTGVYIDGALEMRCRKIAVHYARTWLMFDCVIVFVEWLTLTLSSGGILAHSFTAGRFVRILRFLRLVRLIKFKRLKRKAEGTLNSALWKLTLQIGFNVLCVVMVNHMIAGFWFALGRSSDEGWVSSHFSSSLWHDYFVSLHWAITQFHGSMDVQPKTVQERIFAVIVLLFALLGFSLFLSTTTASIEQMNHLQRDRARKWNELCKFLKQRRIGIKLVARIKRSIEHYGATAQQEHKVELLQLLPEYLLIRLHEELRCPCVLEHFLFRSLYEMSLRLMQKVCHEAMSEMAVRPHEILFDTGEPCQRMLFVNSGRLEYVKASKEFHQQGARSVQSIRASRRSVNSHMSTDSADSVDTPSDLRTELGRKAWLSEASLWTTWMVCGRCVSISNGLVIALHAVEFARVIQVFDDDRNEMCAYAERFVRSMNEGDPCDLFRLD